MSPWLAYECPEYWQRTTWDRFKELTRVPAAIGEEFVRQERLTVSCLRRRLGAYSSARVLDLAGGTGRIARGVLDALANVEVTLVDFNAATLERARSNLAAYDNVAFERLDVHGLASLQRERFDAVVCMDVLHHVADPDSLMAEVARVLRPEGLLVGNVLAAEAFRRYERLKYGWLRATERALTARAARWVYAKAPEALRQRIRRAGLGRIAPASEEETRGVLERHFAVLEFETSLYYWFAAHSRSPQMETVVAEVS